jgi:serine/threonine protein kinase
MIGPPNAPQVKISDFGLSRFWSNTSERASSSLLSCPGRHFNGTAAYASMDCLQGYPPECKDDLESAALTLVYLLRGSLPWTETRCPAKRNQDKADWYLAQRREHTPDNLCRGFPEEFKDFLMYSRNLSGSADPDYARWRGVFDKLMRKGSGPPLLSCFDHIPTLSASFRTCKALRDIDYRSNPLYRLMRSKSECGRKSFDNKHLFSASDEYTILSKMVERPSSKQLHEILEYLQ